MTILSDTYGRRFEKLRVSLTNQCNFNCIYCVGKEPVAGTMVQSARSGRTDSSSIGLKEYQDIITKIHQATPLKQIRFTGGEPLISPYLIGLINYCKSLGIENVGLTTNGWYLESKMKALQESGIDSVNISLDGISDQRIQRMSGHSQSHNVKQTIKLAVSAGLPVKLNAVIMKGKNEAEVLPLLEFARKLNIPLRYIEYMSMGDLHHSKNRYLFTQDEILETIGTRYNFKRLEREKGSTAKYWELSNGGVFGIIANYSAPFCNDCNRLRLDSRGKIYGCLSSNKGIEVKQLICNNDKFKNALKEALGQKQALHFTGSTLSMKYIGG